MFGRGRIATLGLTIAIASPARTSRADDATAKTPIVITSTSPATAIFVREDGASSWTKLGIAPIETSLAPGSYAIESEGPSQSVGRDHFRIGAAKTTLDVHAGNSNVRLAGTLALGTGVCALLGGIVFVATYGHDSETKKKNAVAIPLLAVGGGVSVAGVVLSLLGGTRITNETN